MQRLTGLLVLPQINSHIASEWISQWRNGLSRLKQWPWYLQGHGFQPPPMTRGVSHQLNPNANICAMCPNSLILSYQGHTQSSKKNNNSNKRSNFLLMLYHPTKKKKLWINIFIVSKQMFLQSTTSNLYLFSLGGFN